MNRAFTYITIAAILGLSITLIPTLLLGAYEDAQAHSWGVNSEEPISSTEIKILGVSFLIASAIFILFKRDPGKSPLPPLLRHT
jgi:hypothetical protein